MSVRALACQRGERILFEGLDLDVAAGEAVWLRAANGYGKTSLLRVLAGLAPPAAGTITWGGDGTGPSAYVGHANALKEDLTVLESLAFLARLHGTDTTDRALRDALTLFGLDSRRRAPVRTLSQGQRRRLALARLGLVERGTWLLDEPYDALDHEASATFGRLVAAHRARGGSVVLTSHFVPSLVALREVALDATAPA
jgi:heme exporter protein A